MVEVALAAIECGSFFDSILPFVISQILAGFHFAGKLFRTIIIICYFIIYFIDKSHLPLDGAIETSFLNF